MIVVDPKNIAFVTAISHLLAKQPSFYEKRDGTLLKALRLDSIKEELRVKGWRNISRYDDIDMKDFGFVVEQAQYVGGVRKTGQFINVITLPA